MHSVEVEVFGKSYRLRGEDPQKIKKYAEFLDKELDALYKKFPTVDPNRIITLGAMIVTEKMFQLQAENAILKATIEKMKTQIENLFSTDLE